MFEYFRDITIKKRLTSNSWGEWTYRTLTTKGYWEWKQEEIVTLEGKIMQSRGILYCNNENVNIGDAVVIDDIKYFIQRRDRNTDINGKIILYKNYFI